MSLGRLQQVEKFYKFTKQGFINNNSDKWIMFYGDLEKDKFNIRDIEDKREDIIINYGNESEEIQLFDNKLSQIFDKFYWSYVPPEEFDKLISEYGITLDDKEIDIWNESIKKAEESINVGIFSRIQYHKRQHKIRCKTCGGITVTESPGNYNNYECSNCKCWNIIIPMYEIAYKNDYKVINAIKSIKQIIYSPNGLDVKSYIFRMKLEDRGVTITSGIEKVWNLANDELIAKENLSIGRWEYYSPTDKITNGVKSIFKSLFK